MTPEQRQEIMDVIVGLRCWGEAHVWAARRLRAILVLGAIDAAEIHQVIDGLTRWPYAHAWAAPRLRAILAADAAVAPPLSGSPDDPLLRREWPEVTDDAFP